MSASAQFRLTVLFFGCMLVGTGPGLLLVNRPYFVARIPIVYLWAICWFIVLSVIVVRVTKSRDSLEDGHNNE